MSSNEDDCNEGDSLSTQALKKRRIQRACDICRRKKIRCDGAHMPGNRCSNCLSYNLDCTYVEASKKRGPPKGYVESLENRVEKLDKLLRRLVPDPILFKELHDSIDKERVPFNPSPLVATQQPTSPLASASPSISIDTLTSAIRGTSDNVTAPDVDDTSVLADTLKRLAISPSEYRFLGTSSGAVLIQTAMKLKQEYTQSGEPVHKTSQKPGFSASKSEIWAPQEWEMGPNLSVQSPHYIFPDDDLALELIDLYFSDINLYLPLLHRPTFQKSVTEGLYHTDDGFASIYLLVCANGARFSDDPRVLLDGVDSLDSSGWRWFNQVQMVKKPRLCPPTLYDLQFYCLSVHFLQGSSAPQSCWTMVGFGIRLALDVGVHRRKVHQHIPTAEDEQWKRGFWVLVCMDRIVSAALGRPCAIHDDDYDLELPVDCDDEYWDHPDPKQRFKQPENKPSLISAFILFIKLNQILSYCLRTIYAINKSKLLFGYVGPNWEQHIVAELDSALNKWVDSVPDHLRWDPTREDDDSFKLSASCYAYYYQIQILIHRPFIPSPTKSSPLSFPSLAICTNAARSCSHIAGIQRGRTRFPPLHSNMAVFTSGIVLLLSIWGGKRSGLSIDPNKEMVDVHKCMKTLKVQGERWRCMGKVWDVLCELATAGDLPLPQASPRSTNKRERDCDTPRSVASSESPQSIVQDEGPRVIAGSRRVNKDLSASGQSMRAGQSHHQPSQQRQHPPQLPTSTVTTSRQPTQHLDHSMTVPSTPTYALPVYSDELGRLPLHGHMDFSAQAYLDQANYWYQNVPNNRGIESSSNSDHIVHPNPLSRHSSRQHQQVPDHHHVQSSHNTNGYSNDTSEVVSTIAQGFSLNQTIGTGNMMFDPVPLTYIAPTTYPGVSPSSIDTGPPHNPMRGGGRPSHSSFRGISMALRGDRGGGGSVLEQRQETSQPPSHLEQSHHQHHQHHTQGQRDHDVHGNHHHGEQHQQQQPMGYSYLENDTISMWLTAPTGFELDEWSTYLSNMSELTQGAHGGHGQQQ